MTAGTEPSSASAGRPRPPGPPRDQDEAPESAAPAPIDGFHRRLHRVVPSSLSAATAQTGGMRRLEAISRSTVGSSGLWMGQTHVAPNTRSANHHHGRSETGIYVVRGNPVFVFFDRDIETRLETGPGDYVFVPPWVPHREENPHPADEAVVVIARNTQEAIVVNVDSLHWHPADVPIPGGGGNVGRPEV